METCFRFRDPCKLYKSISHEVENGGVWECVDGTCSLICPQGATPILEALDTNADIFDCINDKHQLDLVYYRTLLGEVNLLLLDFIYYFEEAYRMFYAPSSQFPSLATNSRLDNGGNLNRHWKFIQMENRNLRHATI